MFKRFRGLVVVGLFVVDIAADGTGDGEPQQLTPEGMVLDDTGHAGRWSPDGEEILFVAHKSRRTTTSRSGSSTWGPTAARPASCRSLRAAAVRSVRRTSTAATWPGWSPDGDQIVFTRSEPGGSNESIWIVNADGSDLVQVTDGTDDNPVWGTPP